ECRIQAVETGLIYQFRFKPDTGEYRLEPFGGADAAAYSDPSYTPPDGLPQAGGGYQPASAGASEPRTAGNATRSASSAGGGTGSTGGGTGNQAQAVDKGLPSAITFYNGQIAVDDPLASETRIDSLQARGQSWSSPILFFPDGSCSSASLVLVNNRKQHQRLTLRGLTGVGRASRVLSLNEAQQANNRLN
ncbi:MAG: hypothetical protein AAF961_02690, partial [Planctomycetota bacterium]